MAVPVSVAMIGLFDHGEGAVLNQGFALHGSMDGSNWLILDEQIYNTSTSRKTASDVFPIDVLESSLQAL